METKQLTTSEQDLKTAASILRNGGLVAIPTETVYGLGANGLDPEAVAKIFAAKGRPQDNPLILHIADSAQLRVYCRDIPESAWQLADRFWPGPLTMVLPVSDIVPKVTIAGHDTVAMRCPELAATREIIRLAGVPIAAPSANLSGKPSTTTAQHVLHDMDGKIDAIVDGGPCRVGVESTIVDLTEKPPRLLRPGGITPEQLIEVLGDLTVDKAVTAQISEDTVVRAPGMKYKHYAPRAEVVIVSGTRENAAAFIRRNFSPGCAVLCFAEELPFYAGLSPTAYGREDAPETLSAGLFAALRQLDTPEISRIFARCPEGGGIAYAVQNRLKKSAGFHIVDADGREQPVGGGGIAYAVQNRLKKSAGFHIVDADGREQPVGGGGIAYAVQNRLKKSAGFHIVDADGREQPVGGGVLDAPHPAAPSCHSEERSDEKSTSGEEKILRSAQNDKERRCVIGITGPSGAGKTTALDVLKGFGAEVFDCDALYHELLQKSKTLLAAIEAAFPGTVQNGALDRKALGALVFADPEALARLNAVTHPFVKEALQKRMEKAHAKLIAIDAIGLFEGGLAPLCDLTVAVVAPEEARLARLIARDGIDEQTARARMQAQRSAEEFEALCDVTLHNDGSPEEFQKTCESCFRSYIANI